MGWWKWVGTEGAVVVMGVDRFGESGPGQEVIKIFGFTVENVVSKAKGVLGK